MCIRDSTQPFRQKLTHECPVMIGTVPVYDSVIHYQRDLATLTAQDFIDVVRLHAEDGVDFVTLHCGITRKTIDQILSLIHIWWAVRPSISRWRAP